MAARFTDAGDGTLLRARVGDLVDYRVTVSNAGNTSGPFTVTATLPPGVTFVFSSTCTRLDQTLTCTGAALDPGSSVVLAATVQLQPSLVPAGHDFANVSITSTIVEAVDPAFQTLAASLTVVPAADQVNLRLGALRFETVASGTVSQAREGDTVYLTADVVDVSGAGGTFHYQTQLPPGTTFVYAGGRCSVALGTVEVVLCTSAVTRGQSATTALIGVRLGQAVVPPGVASAPISMTFQLDVPGDADPIGHTATAGLLVLTGPDITPPTIVINNPIHARRYTLNQTVMADYSCADETALASCTGPVAVGAPIDTASVGQKRFDVTATDAGNNVTLSGLDYTVVFPTTGTCLWNDTHTILPPINADGSSVFVRGLPVFARFRVCDANGTPITSGGVVTSFELVSRDRAGVTEPLNSPVPSWLRPSAFRWESFTQTWAFLIDTRSLTRGWGYNFRITLSDGSTIPFRFVIR